jgi:predicted RNA-binding protein YlxR (DUF448 family)
VRVARTADGSLVFGRTLPGRGAWLCRDGLVECSERAATRGGFDRAFRCRVSPASLDALRRAIAVEAGKSDIRFVPGSPPARD